MASTNPYTSFTITQAFLGAPLQFEPALNSREFQELIDAYVTGSSSRADKISQVTLDFYKNATVDLNTGALVRTYNVFPSPWTGYATLSQSPTLSLSSDCSPIYTPSPGSSATFGDSSYGSVSMTPPAPAQGVRARVTKKAKKDTPKAAEARLPGFSIMTKDGIDVTNSAGRGTKTKEQREHAHLMRIMKACDACKKKKVRCDPSHRRSSHEMSRTASTSTQQTSSSGPSSSTPSLSRATTHASSVPSFSPSNPIDDFVLFPEDDSWNADMDLGQFNFDINVDLGDQSVPGDMFDFSFDQQPMGQANSFNYTPVLNDQYGLSQWAEPQGFQPVSHSRPNPASSSGSGQLDANWQSDWLQAESLISPTTTFADNYWPNGSVANPQLLQSLGPRVPPSLSDDVDWSLLESTMVNGSPGLTGVAQNNEQASEPRRNRKRRAAETLEGQDTSLSRNNVDIGILDPSDPNSERLQYQDVSSTGPSQATGDIDQLQNAAQLVSKSLRRIKRAPAEYIALGEELQQLEGTLARLQQHAETTAVPASEAMTVRSLSAQLQDLLPEVVQSSDNGRRNKLSQGLRPHHARELAVAARRLSRSLCATINSVEAHTTDLSVDRPVLPPGRNLQLQVSPSVSSRRQSLQTIDSASSLNDSGYTSASNTETPQMLTQRTSVNADSVASARLVADSLPHLLAQSESTPSDLSAQREGSRPIERRAQSPQWSLDEAVTPSSQVRRTVLNLVSTTAETREEIPSTDLVHSNSNGLQEVQPSGFATSQPRCANIVSSSSPADISVPFKGFESRPGPTSSAEAATAEAIHDATRIQSSHSSIDSHQATTSQQSSTVLRTVSPTFMTTQNNLAGALAILGSIALASSITSGLNLSTNLPYLIPLLALSQLLPAQHRLTPLTTALFAGAFILTSSFTFPGIQDLRSTCTAWLGNEPLAAAAKLALVASLISSEILSSLNLSVMVVAAVNFLVGGSPDGCSSGPTVRVSRGHNSDGHEQGEGSYASWLGMMDMLSPVVAV